MPVDPLSKPFEIWPENETIVLLFLRMATQWRVAMGGLVGLDYTVLFELMNLYDIVDRKDVFESIQVMEGAALPIMNAKG